MRYVATRAQLGVPFVDASEITLPETVPIISVTGVGRRVIGWRTAEKSTVVGVVSQLDTKPQTAVTLLLASSGRLWMVLTL